MTVDFNGKIDGMYLNLNTKFENLNTHVKKLENQVMQTSETIRRQESLIKEKIEAGQNHHINALTDDDFWVEIKREKLLERDSHVENLCSSDRSHRHRSTQDKEHRSTAPMELTISRKPSTIDRQRDCRIDRWFPATKRVHLPKVMNVTTPEQRIILKKKVILGSS
ncbi:hypothetical protein N665_0246s0016 [Sinapis alba]|nr:hypothetical protein N665_0246s0016 [Sinapis alba]